MTCESPLPAVVRQCPHHWRRGSVFDPGGRSFYRPISSNDRATVMARAETLERRTKERGNRDGVLGQSALAILRALLFHFLDCASGQLNPSYKQIQKKTGFCVQTIAQALRRLALAGLLEIHPRIERMRRQVWSEFARRFVWRERVEQITNAYMVNVPKSDRKSLGDFGMPLFRFVRAALSDSTTQRESASGFLSRMDAAKRRVALQGS
jgi:hypothetical protein